MYIHPDSAVNSTFTVFLIGIPYRQTTWYFWKSFPTRMETSRQYKLPVYHTSIQRSKYMKRKCEESDLLLNRPLRRSALHTTHILHKHVYLQRSFTKGKRSRRHTPSHSSLPPPPSRSPQNLAISNSKPDLTNTLIARQRNSISSHSSRAANQCR